MKGVKKLYNISTSKVFAIPKLMLEHLELIDDDIYWEDNIINGEKVIIIRKPRDDELINKG